VSGRISDDLRRACNHFEICRFQHVERDGHVDPPVELARLDQRGVAVIAEHGNSQVAVTGEVTAEPGDRQHGVLAQPAITGAADCDR